jgi:hypothetical protein
MNVHSNIRYVPTTESRRLQHLIEEAGALIATIGKIEQWSLKAYHPDDRRDPPASHGDILLYRLNEMQRAMEMVRIDLLLANFTPRIPHDAPLATV